MGGSDVLPATSVLHLLDLATLLVEVVGQVAVAGDAADVRVVLELVPQLLVVVASYLLSARELRKGTQRQRDKQKKVANVFTVLLHK